MTQLWLYVVASSSDPNSVRCKVPWRVDHELIFFGPCKKHMRERLRRQFLGPNLSHSDTSGNTDRMFIVGINGSNPQRLRKVIWAGRLSEVMTFAKANSRLRGSRFRKLRMDSESPLHVQPIDDGSGNVVGYRHVSKQHIAHGAWVSDLVSSNALRNVRLEGREVITGRGTTWEVFDRDCCLLLENEFFAQGKGIEFDEEALSILRRMQPTKSGIDRYAVFGRAPTGQANGLRGTFLAVSGELADRFVVWLKDRSQKLADHPQRDGDAAGPFCVSRKTHQCAKLP